MKTKILFLFVFLFTYLAPLTHVNAQTSPKVEYEKGKVVSAADKNKIQKLKVEITNGTDKGKTVNVDFDPQGLSSLKLKTGDNLVLAKQTDPSGKTRIDINDRYRIPYVGLFLALFVILIVVIAGRKGIGSIAGLAISLGVIFFYILPSIISGHNPLLVSIIGSMGILLSTTYVAHGFSRQTTIALISTLSALLLTYVIASIVLEFTFLTGLGSEEAYNLHFGLKSLVDFRGLFLGGIIIATLGALNDVTTTQAAAIFEIHKSNPKLEFDELLVKGMSVGREHVVSLVNTLVLAFVGTSLALFLIYFLYPSEVPLWVILNSEIISEEVLKTLVGTAGLLLSMPIVTVLATFVCVNILGDKHK